MVFRWTKPPCPAHLHHDFDGCGGLPAAAPRDQLPPPRTRRGARGRSGLVWKKNGEGRWSRRVLFGVGWKKVQLCKFVWLIDDYVLFLLFVYLFAIDCSFFVVWYCCSFLGLITVTKRQQVCLCCYCRIPSIRQLQGFCLPWHSAAPVWKVTKANEPYGREP